MTASERATTSSSCSTAEGFSSFVITETGRPASSRSSSRSCGRWTKESAIQSAPIWSAKARSRRSFSVMAETGSTAPTTLTPLALRQGPANQDARQRRVSGGLLDFEAHLAVIDEQLNAGRERREDLWVGQRNPIAGPWGRVEVEADPITFLQRDWPLGQAADPQFRPLQVGEDRDGPPGLSFDRADDVVARLVLRVAAVAEVEAEHVRSGLEQRPDHLRAGAGWA